MHLGWRDKIARIHNQSLNRDASDPSSNIQRTYESADGSEECVHRHGDDPQEQQRNEELRCGSLQIGHEVYDNIENEHLYQDQRNIDDCLGNCIRSRSIEGEAFVLQQDWATLESSCEFCESQ